MLTFRVVKMLLIVVSVIQEHNQRTTRMPADLGRRVLRENGSPPHHLSALSVTVNLVLSPVR